MKVVAHIQVQKGYGIAIRASQSPATLMEQSEEYNRTFSSYLEHDRERAVVTVEAEVPDSVFKREPRVVLQGTLAGAPKTNQEEV